MPLSSDNQPEPRVIPGTAEPRGLPTGTETHRLDMHAPGTHAPQTHLVDTHGLYIHVPFCSSRCGYCDFNTYTANELGEGEATSIPGYLRALTRELELAAELWSAPGGVSTVFFGGGTPSILGHEGLAAALSAVKNTVGLAPCAEVTTEANPESTSPEFFAGLREAGFTRVSLGMQSAAGHVLKVLERQHTPGRPEAAVRQARQAGFEHINLDLIYGTPTETDDDLRRSLEAVLGTGVDHVSAYSLIVEDGTAMARKVRRGELPAPDDDVLADRYTMIDATLRSAGFSWYEVSNWSRPGGQCRHNLLYWRGGQWWGAGPGAHGCVELRHSPGQLVRTVNAKHPRTYFGSLIHPDGSAPSGSESGELAADTPVAAGNDAPSGNQPSPLSLDAVRSVVVREELTAADVRTERIMLGLRLAEGIEVPSTPEVAQVVEKYCGLGLLEKAPDQRIRLTDSGRYLADGIITDIIVALD